MKIAVQTGGPEEQMGIDGAYKLIAECGFDAVDANVDHLASCRMIIDNKLPEYFTGSSDAAAVEMFRPWGEAAKKYGLDNYQAHAPFPSWVDSENKEVNDLIIKMLKRCIMGCAEIGCRRMIVHPFYKPYPKRFSPEDEWALNIERYGALAETARKYGVIICLENMFSSYRDKTMEAICSDPRTAAKYIDTLNEMSGGKQFGFCLDTGHMLVLGKDLKQVMITLGDRIEAFHIHDNNGMHDQHLAPYMGVQDWSAFIDGLKAIRFNKTISFETFNIWNTIDAELCPEVMRVIAKAGRLFIKRAGM